MPKQYTLLILTTLWICACGNNGDNNSAPSTQLTTPTPAEPELIEIVVDVQASHLYGDFTLNGNPFPQIIYDSGTINLRDKNTGDWLELAETPYQLYDTMLVNGEYESVYRFFTGDSVPANHDAVLDYEIEITEDQEMDIDVPAVSVQASFTLDGGSFPASIYNSANFYLQPVDSDELILLGESHTANDSVTIVPGEYHVIYQHQTGESIPVNKNVRIQSNVNILANTPNLQVNVISDEVMTQFTHNSTAFPVSQYHYGRFFLVNLANNDEAFIGNSYEPPSAVKVVRGVYSVSYRHQQGSDVPINTDKIIADNFDTSSSPSSINISTITISINPSLNGEAFPASQYHYADIELYDKQTASLTHLGSSHSDIENLSIIPGIYNIQYSHQQGNLVPLNINGTVIADRNINTNETIELDVIAHELSSSFTLDNENFPQSAYSTADIVLRGQQTSEDIVLTATNDQSESILVLPGNYAVVYQCVQCLEIPANPDYLLNDDLNISEDLEVTADIQSVRIEVSATLNGAPFPASIYNSGYIWAGTHTNDAISLMRSYETAEDIIVAAGNYTFYYQHFTGTEVPINQWAEILTRQIGSPMD